MVSYFGRSSGDAIRRALPNHRTTWLRRSKEQDVRPRGGDSRAARSVNPTPTYDGRGASRDAPIGRCNPRYQHVFTASEMACIRIRSACDATSTESSERGDRILHSAKITPRESPLTPQCSSQHFAHAAT